MKPKAVPTTIMLSTRMRRALQRTVGRRHQSQFIREAVAAALGDPTLAEVAPQGRPKAKP